jgi:PAS domain S-box-containing protein
MKLDIRWWHIIALVIIIAGVFLTIWTAQQQDQRMRTELLTKAKIATESIDPARLETLNGSPSDITSPDYQYQKAKLARIRAADPSIRFAYLMGQRPDGGVFFYGDSEPADSPDYSPPGQEYPEVSALFLKAFSEKAELTEGPSSDRWGTSVSAIVPITDPETGQLIAFFGMDVEAKNWNSAIAQASASIITATLLILVLVIAFGLIQRRNQREERRLAASEDKFSRAFHLNPALMVISSIKEGRFLDVNSSFVTALGYSLEEVIGKTPPELGLYSDPTQWEVIQSQFKDAGQVRDLDVKIIRKDHDMLDGSFSAIPIEVNGIPSMLSVILDITERKQAEEALYLSLVMDGVPTRLSYVDADLRFVYTNKAYADRFGRTSEDLAGKSIRDVYGEEVFRQNFPHYQRVLNGKTVSFESNTYDTEGFEYFEIITLVPHYSGELVRGFFVSIMDITERKLAEDALAKSEEMFRTLLERVPSIGVQGYRPDHTVVYWNEANTLIYGYTAEEAIGRDIRDLLIPLQARDEVTKAIARMAESGIPEPSAELELLHKNGSLVPVFSSHAVVKIPGRSTIQFCFDVDLSERKKAEETIRENEKRFRTIINSMQFGIVIIDAQNHTILEANPKALEMIGGTSELVLGSVCHRFICPAELGKCPVTDLSQTVDSSERVLLNQRGERIPVVKSVIKTMLGGKEVLMESFIDITDRKVAEDTLQRVNQKLNVLSQLTRKDLTSQTFVLSSYLELTKNQLVGQDRIIETLQKGFEAVRTIHRTIEYSKDYQDMGAKPTKWQNMKMALLLGLSHISIGEIQHSIETGNLEIFADPLLEKVCQRLLENSVKHGDHVTRIRVWHTITPDGATIFFEDDGIGIPQERKEQIFLRSEGPSASRGSLIFVREILDITSITIRETGEPGKGARFEMMVPKGAWRMAGEST